MPIRNEQASAEADSSLQQNLEFVPGTEYMKDSSGSDDRALVLLPQPNRNDPADPLNWSTLRKVFAAFSIALYSFITTTAALGMAPMFRLFAETFDISEEEEPLITGVTVMVLGFSNFIVIPFSKIFGRRAVVFVFGILFLVTCIWQAVAKSYGSFMGARAVIGIAAAPSETLMVQVVADLFFLHERGFWMVVYFASVSLGAFIGPVISGNIAQRYGWRSFFWLSTGLIAFCLILMLFLFPETKYEREPTEPTLNRAPTATDTKLEVGQSTQHVETHIDGAVASGKGRPSAKQLMFFQQPHPLYKKFLIRDFVAPARVALLPIVLFTSLNIMGTANMVLYWNITESMSLRSPPHNFTASQVGFANFGFAGGALIGMATAGPLSDWMVKRATLRNHGVREAEMRLPALIPFAIVSIVGTVLGGVAMRDGWAWPVQVVLGYGSAGMAISTLPAITVAYAVDAYKPISGEIMVVATVFKNTTGFGMTYWVGPMIARHGYILPLMIWFIFTVGPMLLAIPLYFWGKRLRVATKNSSVHKYEEFF